jgi:hypothetical protein
MQEIGSKFKPYKGLSALKAMRTRTEKTSE